MVIPHLKDAVESAHAFVHGIQIGTFYTVSEDGRNQSSIFYFREGLERISFTNAPTLPLGLRFTNWRGDLILNSLSSRNETLPSFFSSFLPRSHLYRDFLGQYSDITLLTQGGDHIIGAWHFKPLFSNPEYNIPFAPLPGIHIKLSVGRTARGINFAHNAADTAVFSDQEKPSYWLAKFPFQTQPQRMETEFSFLLLATLCGLRVPRIALVKAATIAGCPLTLQEQEQRVLLIERYDRGHDGLPIHSENFEQLFDAHPCTLTSSTIIRTLAAECGIDDALEGIKRLTFAVLIGQTNLDRKKWVLIHPLGKKPCLAPAHGFNTGLGLSSEGQNEMALPISRLRAFSNFTKDELYHLAAHAGLPKKIVIRTALETTQQFLECWQRERYHLPLSHHLIEAVDSHLRHLPFIKEIK